MPSIWVDTPRVSSTTWDTGGDEHESQAKYDPFEESRMRLEEHAALSRTLRTPRAAGIAGVQFAVLLTAALVLVRLAAPADPADAFFLGEPAKRRLAILARSLVPFAGIAFLWFIGDVRDRIGEREDRFFATVFLGSGLLFVSMLFVASAATAAFVADAGVQPGAPQPVSGFGRRIGAVV